MTDQICGKLVEFMPSKTVMENASILGKGVETHVVTAKSSVMINSNKSAFQYPKDMERFSLKNFQKFC